MATAKDLQALDDLSNWFSAHLPVPDRFSVSPKPNRKAQAISWFRDSATAYIYRMCAYQRILEPYGAQVVMLRTSRPGYIVYEDEHQIAAYPFADTPS